MSCLPARADVTFVDNSGPRIIATARAKLANLNVLERQLLGLKLSRRTTAMGAQSGRHPMP
jgi:hypothetical protein